MGYTGSPHEVSAKYNMSLFTLQAITWNMTTTSQVSSLFWSLGVWTFRSSQYFGLAVMRGEFTPILGQKYSVKNCLPRMKTGKIYEGYEVFWPANRFDNLILNLPKLILSNISSSLKVKSKPNFLKSVPCHRLNGDFFVSKCGFCFIAGFVESDEGWVAWSKMLKAKR